MTPFVRRWLPPAAVAIAVLGVVACNPKTATKSTNQTAAQNIGPSLYPSGGEAKVAVQPSGPDPIIGSQAQVQFDETITLSAEVDGKLELVATPYEDAVKLKLDAARYPERLIGHPRMPDWKHVRLVDGDVIKQGQVLANLDDSQAILDKQALEASADAAKKALEQSEASLKEYDAVVKKIESLGNAASELEKIRYRIEQVQAKVTTARQFQEYTKLKGDLDKAVDRKMRHQIVSPFDGKVVRVLRPRGVVVKAGEPILEIQNTSRFRVEAKVPQELAAELDSKLPLPVGVEPVKVLRPEPYTASHRQEVTGLAVFTWTAGGKSRPVVVSASADGTAKVWDATGEKQSQHVLPHPSGTAVRCVAAAARGDSRLVATGDGNGKVRLWDVSDLTQLPTKPTHEFDDAHTQAVGAAAFSADGQFLATAAGRDVFVWDVGGKKRKYSLPADHRDDVKAVHFTPQATLVTVCRDKAIRVWKLGSEGASLERTIDHRSGAVDVLDVTADGGRVLFDLNAGRIDLVNLADNNTVGSLLNTGSGQRFSGLALFSPDSKLVLTGAGDADAKGELQLWAVPDSGRGAERKRLAVPDRTAVTCAAFSPDPAQRFVAVGTQSGGVHFWNLPPLSDQATLPGKLVSVTRPDQTTAVLRVEVDNPGGKYDDQLQDRGTARLVIDRTAKALPPGPMPVVPPMPGTKAQLPPVVVPIAGK